MRNYAYDSWQLKLRHITSVLVNLGINPEMIFNVDTFYNSAFEHRIHQVKEFCKYVGKPFR